MLCLDRALAHAGGIVEVLRRADAAAVERTPQIVAGLPDLHACADVERLLAAEVPIDAEARAVDVGLARELARASAQLDAGDPGARAAFEDLVARSLEAGAHGIQAKAHLGLGRIADEHQAFVDAEQAIYAGIAAAELAADDEARAKGWMLLVNVHGVGLHRADDSDRAASQARAVLARIGGSAQVEAELATMVGLTRFAQGRFAEARAEYERALDLRDRTVGPDAWQTAAAQHNLANVEMQEGAIDDALALWESALLVYEARLGSDHPFAALVRTNIGIALDALGRTSEAEAQHRAALDVFERSDALDRAHVVLANLGSTVCAQGRPAECLELCERALAIKTRVLPPHHPSLAYGLECVGSAWLELQRPDRAEPPLSRAVELLESTGADPVELAHARFELARAIAPRDPAQAVALARAAADVLDGRDRAVVEEWLATGNGRP
jgi:tetratricopeptide (TPR) repeat protein